MIKIGVRRKKPREVNLTHSVYLLAGKFTSYARGYPELTLEHDFRICRAPGASRTPSVDMTNGGHDFCLGERTQKLCSCSNPQPVTRVKVTTSPMHHPFQSERSTVAYS